MKFVAVLTVTLLAVASAHAESDPRAVTRLMPSAAATPQPLAPQPPAPAAAPLPPGSPDARYTMHTVQDAVLRLDGRTGQVSVCGPQANGWSCRAIADDRVALEGEISRLQAENGTLKRELLSRNLPLPGGMEPPGPLASVPPKSPDANPNAPQTNTPQSNLPSVVELDRAMGIISKAWQRMVDMMVGLQRDIGNSSSGPALPRSKR
jgi:hypothetical protein